MNERIIELRKEAYNLVQIDLQTNERDEPVSEREHLKMVFDKFAELIVKDCINKVRSRQMFGIQDEHNIHHAFDLLVYDLESHFGFEE